MKIALLFPGYGSQYVGMAKDIYDESRTMQEYFEEASNCLNINFVKLCFASSDAELGKMNNAYTATFLVSCSLYALIKEAGVAPTMLAGHNLGEYSAIYASGGINFPDGLYLLNKYASIYQEAIAPKAEEDAPVITCSLLAIKGIERDELEKLCRKIRRSAESELYVALDQEHEQLVVAGNEPGLEAIKNYMMQNYPDSSWENAPAELGLNSPLMDPVVRNFTMYLEKVDFKDLSIPVMSNTNAKIMTTGDQIRSRVIGLIDKPIAWHLVIDALADYDLVIEVGPGTTLTNMVKAKYPDKLMLSINKQADIEELKNYVKASSSQQTPEPTEI